MEIFDDEFGDLSQYKILSFEEVSKGFEGNKNPLQEIASSSFEDGSAFKNSPFGQYWEKRIPKYAEEIYGSGLALGRDEFRIFDLSKKFSNSQADLYSLLISEDWKNIDFKVFAHPDGAEVLKQYANTDFKPADNEILFLIETNDGKFDFGKIVRVKLGKNAIEKIRFQFPFLNQTDEKELAKTFIERAFELSNDPNFLQVQKEVKADVGEIKNLLVKAIKYEYQNKKFDDMAWFTKILQGADFLGFKIPELLLEKTAKMRTKKFEDEKYWNAHLEKGFTPAFLPGVVDPKSNKDIKNMIIQKIKKEIDKLVPIDNDDSTFDRVFKQIYETLLLNLLQVFADLLEKEVSEIEKLFPNGENLDNIYSSNAFLVGLWNGCIEFVASIVDMVALFMIIERNELGFTVTDALFEKFENLLNSVMDNFPKFLLKLWEKLKVGLTDFALWYLKYGDNKYYWYKELGELTPDIVTIVVPALKAGKIGKTGAVTKELSEELNEKTARELANTLEQRESKQLIDDAFKNAEKELEDRIPKETEIEEVKLKPIKKLKLKPSWLSNRVIATKPNETVTLLGSYMKDTKRALEELNYPKSTNFGAKNGDFNLLNVPDEIFEISPDFFKEYNLPWLIEATNRGDDCIILSDKFNQNLLFRDGELTGFGKEIQFMDDLVNKGIYKFVKEEGKYIKIKK